MSLSFTSRLILQVLFFSIFQVFEAFETFFIRHGALQHEKRKLSQENYFSKVFVTRFLRYIFDFHKYFFAFILIFLGLHAPMQMMIIRVPSEWESARARTWRASVSLTPVPHTYRADHAFSRENMILYPQRHAPRFVTRNTARCCTLTFANHVICNQEIDMRAVFLPAIGDEISDPIWLTDNDWVTHNVVSQKRAHILDEYL